MSGEKKIVLTVITDIILIAILIFSVYMLLFRSDEVWKKNLFSTLVVLSIPTIFFVTYTNVTADKYNFDIYEDDVENDKNDSSENEQDEEE